jgi:hypothetical protein
LIIAAVDEKLARAIFRTIRDANPRSVLQRLRLEVDGAGNFGVDDYDETFLLVTQFIGRKFLCHRSPRDDCRSGNAGALGDAGDDVIVQELGLRDRKLVEDDVELREYEGVFRDIWPDRTGDWKKDWFSYMLVSA